MLKNVLNTIAAIFTLGLASYPAWLVVQWLDGFCLPVSGLNGYIATAALAILICLTFSSFIFYIFRGSQTMPPNDVEEDVDGNIKPVYVPEGWRFWFRVTPVVIWIAFAVGLLLWQNFGPQECCGFHLPSVINSAEAAEVVKVNSTDCRRGYDYLMALAKRSGDEMSDVPSRYDRNKSVAQTVADVAVAAPFVLENMHPAEFKAVKSQSAKAELVCRVLAEYGRHGSQAYRDEVNGNYLGPAQISGGIYQVHRRLYPGAGLPADSNVGRRNHLSAAKATRLNMDSARFEMSAAAKKRIGNLTEWWNRVEIASHNMKTSEISLVVEKCGKGVTGSAWRDLKGCMVRVSKAKKGKKSVFRQYHLPEKTSHYMTMYVDGVYEVFKDFGAFDRQNS